MRAILVAAITLAACAAAPAVRAATNQVGSGKTYSTVQAAVNASGNGDVVEVYPGTYSGAAAVAVINNSITIRGVGTRPVLDATGYTIPNGKAIFVAGNNNANNASITVENLEFMGAAVPSANGAGIRPECTNLVVRNCYFHNNQDGIQGGWSSSSILFEYCEFAYNGAGDGQSHNIYIGSGVSSFTMRFCYTHDANQGHLIKTRANTNYILYNRITDENGTGSYVLQFPQGGLCFVVGNLIEKGANNVNHVYSMCYADENQSNPIQNLYFANNTFVNDLTSYSPMFIHVVGTPGGKVVNNILVGPGTATDAGVGLVWTNNLFWTTAQKTQLVSAATFDYHLIPTSTAIDQGVTPGVYSTFDLTPLYQYVHPTSNQVRTIVGALDLGAYETTNGMTPTYIITASAGPGGTIAPSGTLTATSGTSRAFVIAPSNGFTIASLLVDGASVGATNAFTLTNIVSNHTLVASFAPIVNPPVITSALTATGTLGMAFSYVITATNQPSGFAAAGLPAGLSVNPASGAISGTPSTVGTWAVTISATNVSGSATQTLTLAVCCAISASAGPGGTIAPSGSIVVPGGGTQTFASAAGAYYVLAGVQVDDVPVGATASYTFNHVITNHTIAASFTALLAPQGTPQWWLAQYGWTNNFAAAELADPDGDGVPTWMEYLAATNPANPLSRPDYNTAPYAESFENLAGWGGVYTNVFGRKGWSTSDPLSDQSRIVNLPCTLSPSNQPLPSATHTNVLRVDTQGAMLTNSFGTGLAMSGLMTYVDMAVQWNPGDVDLAPLTTTDTGVKCGVYANTSSNLMVYHGVADAGGRLLSNVTDATAVSIDPTNWYRLTITIDATASNAAGAPAMFRVKVNGVSITHAAAYADSWRPQFNASGVLPATSPSGTWFRLATTNAFALKLTSLNFQGTGYLDDLVVTNGDPWASSLLRTIRGTMFFVR